MSGIRGKGATFKFNGTLRGQIKRLDYDGKRWRLEDGTTVDQADDCERYVPTVYDPGVIRVRLQLVAADYDALKTLSDERTSKTFEIALPQIAGTTKFDGNAFLVNITGVENVPSNVMEYDLELKPDGPVNFDP